MSFACCLFDVEDVSYDRFGEMFDVRISGKFYDDHPDGSFDAYTPRSIAYKCSIQQDGGPTSCKAFMVVTTRQSVSIKRLWLILAIDLASEKKRPA